MTLPGDKSISHRLAILAALAEGPSELHNYSPAADCQSTLECLRRLGVGIQAEKPAGKARDQKESGRNSLSARIHGTGLGGWKKPGRALDAGNSGTTMRLLAGALAGQEFAAKLTGDASLRRRPMRRVVEPLEQMGARIRSREGGLAPLEITGTALHSTEYTLPVPSAQVKSAILLAALYAPGITAVIEPVRTRDHTEIALREFGAAIRRSGERIEVSGGARLQGRSLTVPGDLSSAVFLIAAALILPGSNLLLLNVGLNPTRGAVLDFLVQMGAPLRVAQIEERHGELVGNLEVITGEGLRLRGGEVAIADVPRMIDELPMLAALAPYTEQGILIRGAAELRVKESDRIAALSENLRRMGARVEEFPDGMLVAGRAEAAGAQPARHVPLHGAEVDPRGDHRIAMALAIAALGADGPTTLRGSECAAVSYPAFFSDLEALLER